MRLPKLRTQRSLPTYRLAVSRLGTQRTPNFETFSCTPETSARALPAPANQRTHGKRGAPFSLVKDSTVLYFINYGT
jgi:hypothetical protein